MKKNGFTLIELLAVIVILPVIALIATHVIMNAINEAKKGAAKDSAYSYMSALEYYIASTHADDDTNNDFALTGTLTEAEANALLSNVKVKGS
jgi:prepilin-type N-terminal cleavage/methylation domain-containing protein